MAVQDKKGKQVIHSKMTGKKQQKLRTEFRTFG